MTESDKEGDIYGDPTLSDVWRQRVQQYGARCVINLTHPPQYFDLVTAQQKQRIFPLLSASLTGNETTLLDFGCGPGRFSPDLVRFVNGGKVVGFDVCQELLDLAPASPNVHYTSSSAELASDAYRGFFDVIWICLVLGGIPDEKCAVIAEGLMRNLKPGGLLFLVEHVSDSNPGSSFWRFRPFERYQAMFPQVALSKVGQYLDLRQEVTVMTGPKVG